MLANDCALDIAGGVCALRTETKATPNVRSQLAETVLSVGVETAALISFGREEKKKRVTAGNLRELREEGGTPLLALNGSYGVNLQDSE